MPVVNPLARELVFKIVYYGPGLGGKTTSLQYVHATSKPEHRGKMVSLATPVDRTLYFDFLPIRLPLIRGLGVRLQLFTVPGQVYYNATRKLVLTGADGVVMVVDSQRARIDSNIESLLNLKDNLREHGRSLDQLPHIFQYNKRDLPDTTPIEELDQKLNQYDAPSFATVATRGEGVYESLEAIARAVLEDFEQRMPETRQLAEQQLELPEGGLTEALRQADGTGLAPLFPTPPPPYSGLKRRPSGVLSLAGLLDTETGEAAARAISDDAKNVPDRASPFNGERQPAPESVSLRNLDDAWGSGDSKPGLASRALPARDPRSTAPTGSEAGGLSLASLWPEPEQVTIASAERAIADGRFDVVILRCDELVTRALAGAGAVLGAASDAPRDPSVTVLLLGIDGRDYIEFRRAVRTARAGEAPTRATALAALVFAAQTRIARTRLGV